MFGLLNCLAFHPSQNIPWNSCSPDFLSTDSLETFIRSSVSAKATQGIETLFWAVAFSIPVPSTLFLLKESMNEAKTF
jgi:hypothetical protein